MNQMSCGLYKKFGRMLLLVTLCCVATLWICTVTLDFKLTSLFYRSKTIDKDEGILSEWFDTYNSSFDEDVACKVPRLNPYDQSIIQFIAHPGPARCAKTQPFLTYIDEKGYLTVNSTEVPLINRNFSCVYSTFDRSEGHNENGRRYQPEKKLLNATKLNSIMVDVKCRFSDDSKTFYHNIHAHPIPEPNLVSTNPLPNEEQLNVFFFHVDSVSHSAFKRNLRQTRKYTTEVMGMKYFNAFNKVGINSFPNLMAALTGLRMYDEQPGMLNEVPPNLYINDSVKFDDWPLVWERFEKKGYSTVFIEDNEHIGLFNYNAKGFERKPFYYYYYPFFRAIDDTCKPDIKCWYCFANYPITQITTDLITRHFAALKLRRMFLWASTTEFSHDNENEVEKIDKIMVDFWSRLHENHLLNRTVVFFVSDHGIRFGKIRQSLIGFLEEQLPFYGVWFPDWFYKKHPHIEESLNRNMEILSSTFDVHETFLDILNSNFQGEQRNVQKRGQSQLYPLPKNRTCNQAGIPDQYCSCVEDEALDVDDALVVESANFTVTTLNEILSDSSHICQKIELNKIVYANKVGITKAKTLNDGTKSSIYNFMNTTTKNDLSQKMKIQFRTIPYDAVFSALVKVTNFEDEKKKEFVIIGDIIRVSRYAGLSDCTKDKRLKMYCPCKDVPSVSSSV